MRKRKRACPATGGNRKTRRRRRDSRRAGRRGRDPRGDVQGCRDEGQVGGGEAEGGGDGVETDKGQALNWYQLAADQGHAKAQHNLAVLYLDGDGTERDEVTALMWLILSERNGFAAATQRKESVAADLSSQQVAEAQRRADEKHAANSQ